MGALPTPKGTTIAKGVEKVTEVGVVGTAALNYGGCASDDRFVM